MQRTLLLTRSTLYVTRTFNIIKPSLICRTFHATSLAKSYDFDSDEEEKAYNEKYQNMRDYDDDEDWDSDEFDRRNRVSALESYRRARMTLQMAREYHDQTLKIVCKNQTKMAWNTMKSPKRTRNRWKRGLPMVKEE